MGNKKITKIAEILPDNLSEATVNKIAALVQEAIEQEVNDQLELLAARTTALLRAKVDQLKEQALKELELEDENFRNLELMKYIKGLFALEVGAVDNDVAAQTVMEEAAAIHKDSEALLEQLDTTIKENRDLERAVELMDKDLQKAKKKIMFLEGKLQDSTNSRKAADAILEDIKAPGFAKTIKGKSDRPVSNDQDVGMGVKSNPLITEDFFRLIK